MPLPTVLLMENVAALCNQKNIHNLQKVEMQLASMGYKNFVQVLDTSDYGLPQHRERVFMVSILGDYSYEFGAKMELKLKLKDMLSKNVDEKYYLSDSMIDYITAKNDKWTGNNKGGIINRNIGVTLNTKPGGRRRDASNYICNELPDNYDLCSIPNQINVVGNYGNGHHAKDIVDSGGLSATITTGNHGLGHSILIKNNTEKGYLEAKDGDGIDISSRMHHHRGNVQKNKCQTLTTTGGVERGVVINEYEITKTDKKS